MTTLASIQFFVAINLLVIGLSHFLQPKIWIDFFKLLHSKGHAGNIFNALLSLGMGSIIVAFHFIWEWPIILVTLYGLALVIKGCIYLLFPSLGLKSIGRIEQNAGKLKWIGLIMFGFSILLLKSLFI